MGGWVRRCFPKIQIDVYSEWPSALLLSQKSVHLKETHTLNIGLTH